MAKTATEALNTLKLSGFNERQAQAILELMDENTLTRKDLRLLEQGIKLWFVGVSLSIAGVLCVIGFALHNGYKTSIAGVESRLQADITGVKEDIKGVKEDIKGVKEDIKGVKEDIKDLKNSVRRIEETLLSRKL